MFIDKQKAKRGAWRIPEQTLFIITALRRRNSELLLECICLDIKLENFISQ